MDVFFHIKLQLSIFLLDIKVNFRWNLFVQEHSIKTPKIKVKSTNTGTLKLGAKAGVYAEVQGYRK